MIEHPNAVRDLDAILDVDGLSAAIAAPFDLSVNMGFSDGPNHPEVREAIELIMRKIKAKGMRLLSFAITPEQADSAMNLGVNDLLLGFDPMYIQASVQLFMANVTKLRGAD